MSPLEQPINFQALALGRHLTIEYYDCDTKVLADVSAMEKLFVAAAEKSGATVLESSFHEFQPQGVSGIVVICESHFAVHAWPEHDYAAVDIFTCGDQIDFELAANALRNALGSRSMVISNVLSRGLIGQNGHLLYEEPNQSVSECSLSWRKRYESVDAWGMLASVDVYDCPDAQLNEDTIRNIAGNICEKLNAAECCSLCNVTFHAPERGEGLRFTQILDAGTVTGRYSAERKTFYCDIFLSKFFDPREISEMLINSLQGRYYRLQVAMRQ